MKHLKPFCYKKWQKSPCPKYRGIGDVGRFWMIPSWSSMSMSDHLNNFGSIWCHSKPSEVVQYIVLESVLSKLCREPTEIWNIFRKQNTYESKFFKKSEKFQWFPSLPYKQNFTIFGEVLEIFGRNYAQLAQIILNVTYVCIRKLRFFDLMIDIGSIVLPSFLR